MIDNNDEDEEDSESTDEVINDEIQNQH